MEALIEKCEYDMYCVCEHHLSQVECDRVRKRLHNSGWSSVFHPASVSTRQQRSRTSLQVAAAAGTSGSRVADRSMFSAAEESALSGSPAAPLPLAA